MKKIAVIISQVEESCQSRIWDGIVSTAEEHGVELMTFVAYSLDSDNEIRSHYKMFQSFITENHFDGVILFTGAMSEYTPWPTVKRYAESISLPLVTIAGSIGSGSNIIINNRSGIIEQITHLVENHNKRNIAFIKGPDSNEEAAERFDAYREALEQNGIEYDERLTQPGDFSEESGSLGIRNLLKKEVFFDAVVCVDDYTAIGALREMNKFGIGVPHDVSLVGFDDIAEASMMTPALTTIQQPFSLQGSTALETLLEMIEATTQEQNNTIMLNTHAVYRSSCGCTAEEVRQFRENWHAERSQLDRSSLHEFLSQLEALIAYQLLEMHFHGRKGSEYRQFILSETEHLWNSFFDEVEDHKTNASMLETLQNILKRNGAYTDDISIWQAILSNLGPFTFHFESRNEQLLAGAILQECRISLDSYEKRQIQISSYDKMSTDESIRESCTSIITAGSQNELVSISSDIFEEHGFKNVFMALFNHYSPIPHDEWHLPAQIYAQMHIINGETTILENNDSQNFSSTELLPERFCGEYKGTNSLFLPIYMNSEYFGYIITEVIPDAPKELYSELQIHISSAYRSCFMVDNLRALSMNDELTGLSNRRGFMLLANQLHARAVNSGVDLLFFYFDMDNLKRINDSFSHEDGDHAIKATASLLRRTFRNHDIIGRMGGDEFVSVIEETVPGLEKIMSKRLRDLISTYNKHSGLPYNVDLSIGTATLKITGEKCVEDILKEADHAMFLNKRDRKKGRS